MAELRKNRTEVAFGELVRRYTNLVFSAAKRRLGNVAQAEEVTQTVFIRLAKAVPDLRSDAELAAWLHRTTVYASIDTWRSEMRRRNREEHAAAMQLEADENSTWNAVSPVLDELLNELNDAERQVILLRFFERRSMRDLGLALGISEDAAKMRVSRAMEHLRSMCGERGVICGAALLGALLVERAVEAAPAALILKLATLQIPASATLAPATGTTSFLAQASKAKLFAGFSALLIVGAITSVWLTSANRADRSAKGETAAAPPALAGNRETAPLAPENRNGIAAAGAPDPVKLLQAVARARNRIISGEVDLDVATYEFDRAFEGTNEMRLTVRFDGAKRRSESFAREYSYTSTEPGAGEAADSQMRTEGLDHDAAVQAGLLKPFESHHVRAFDGAVLLDYWENDGKPVQTRIEDPAQGSGYLFDPRCLGIDASPNLNDTIENCLYYNNPASVQLAGEELVEGVSAWHIRVWRGTRVAEFWLETANPVRVLRQVFNGSEVASKYDLGNPQDPIPTEVRALVLHGTTGTQTAFTQRLITRRAAQFNVAIDPAAWTLAGLGMKTGTAVADDRIGRRIGYWTGIGLSEGLPREKHPAQGPPSREELNALLERDPASPWALVAAEWVIFNTPDGPEVDRAAEVVLREHIRDTNLVSLCQELERLRPRSSQKLLEAMLERNPSRDVRGNACFSLAALRKDAAKYGQNQKATEEAERLFERVIKEYGGVKRNGSPLQDLAKPELAELRQLTIGQSAPETQGTDFEGRPIKLSDYRGSVVLLIFWGECGGCRPEIRPLLNLVDRLSGKPFSIMGIYCDEDPAKGKSIAQETQMIWPSAVDGRSGPISATWNNHGWPSFDVVDAKGIIRYRNLSEVRVTEAITSLLSE